MLKKPRRFPNKSIRLKKRLTSTQTSFSAVTIPRRKPGEEVDDEELVRAKAKKNKFDSGYDFFDEAPKKSMGVIKSSDLRDAEDVDVIGEVERKAETVKQNALEKRE